MPIKKESRERDVEEDRVGEILFEGEFVGGSGVGGHGRKWRVASEEWRAVIRMREVEALRLVDRGAVEILCRAKSALLRMTSASFVGDGCSNGRT